jgi:predicted MFS family arabinose efflux permease
LIKLPPRFEKAESNAFESIKEGLRYVRNHRIVTTAMSLIAIASICTFSYPTLLPVFTDKVLSGKAGVYAALMTSIGAGALVTAILIAMIGNIRKKGQVATRGTILFPLALWLLSFMKNPTGAYISCFIAGSTMISLTAVMNTLVQSAIDDNYRGRVMSLYVLLFLGPLPFGSLIAGRLAESIGVVNTIRLGATISIISSLLVLNRNREFMRFES